MCPSRKESRRIARRRQEAEQWAQALMNNQEHGSMPTNKSATDYLNHRYPWLLTQSQDSNQEPHPSPSTQTAEDSTTALQIAHSASNSQTPVVLLPTINETRTPFVVPKPITFGSPHRSFAAILASEAPPAVPEPIVRRKVSLRISERATHDTEKLKPAISDDANDKRSEESTAHAGPSFLDAHTAAKDSAGSMTAEQFRALSSAIDDKMGSLIADSKSHQDENLLDILKETVSWMNKREQTLSHQETRSARETDSGHGASSVNPPDEVHAFIKSLSDRSQAQFELAASERSRALTEETFGGPEPEALLFATTQARHTVLLPKHQTFRLSSSNLTQTTIAPPSSSSLRKQSLRPEAPVFIPHSSRSDAGTSIRNIDGQSRLPTPSTATTFGSQSVLTSTRPTTSSSAANGSKPFSINYLPNTTRINASAEVSASRRPDSARLPNTGKLTGSLRLVPINTMVTPVWKLASAHLEYMSAPGNDFRHRARCAFAVGIASHVTGLKIRELLSFLAIRIPAIDKMIAHPLAAELIERASETGGKYDLAPFMVPEPRSAVDDKSPHPISPSSKDEPHWQPKDFEGFRILPISLNSLQAGCNLDHLAEVAGLRKHEVGSKMQSSVGLPQNPQAPGLPPQVKTVADRVSTDQQIDSLAQTLRSHKDDPKPQPGWKPMKSYKEDAYFSDPDDDDDTDSKFELEPRKASPIARGRSKQRLEQYKKDLRNPTLHQPKDDLHAPPSKVERQSQGLLDAYRAHISRQLEATKDQQESQKKDAVPRRPTSESPTPMRHAVLPVWPQSHHPYHNNNSPHHAPQQFWPNGVPPMGPRSQNGHPNQHFVPTYRPHPGPSPPGFHQ